MNSNTHFHEKIRNAVEPKPVRLPSEAYWFPANLPGRLSVLPNTAAASMPGTAALPGLRLRGRRPEGLPLHPKVPPKGPPKDDVTCYSTQTASRHAAGPRSFQIWKCLTLCQLLVVFWEILLSADIRSCQSGWFLYLKGGMYAFKASLSSSLASKEQVEMTQNAIVCV